jgi:hypothetical protein
MSNSQHGAGAAMETKFGANASCPQLKRAVDHLRQMHLVERLSLQMQSLVCRPANFCHTHLQRKSLPVQSHPKQSGSIFIVCFAFVHVIM